MLNGHSAVPCMSLAQACHIPTLRLLASSGPWRAMPVDSTAAATTRPQLPPHAAVTLAIAAGNADGVKRALVRAEESGQPVSRWEVGPFGGMSPIELAARVGDAAVLDALVMGQEWPHWEAGCEDALNLLVAAATAPDETHAAVEWVMAKQAYTPACLGRALAEAASHGRMRSVETLLGAGASVDEEFPGLPAALVSVARRGHQPLLARMLAVCGGPWCPLYMEILHAAAEAGQPESIRNVVAAGWDVEERRREDDKTALQVALTHGHVDCALELLSAGAKATPDALPLSLQWVTKARGLELLGAIIAAGGDVELVDMWKLASPLMECANPDGIKWLVNHGGACVNARMPFLGYTALHAAVARCDKPAVAALLELGADPTVTALWAGATLDGNPWGDHFDTRVNRGPRCRTILPSSHTPAITAAGDEPPYDDLAMSVLQRLQGAVPDERVSPAALAHRLWLGSAYDDEAPESDAEADVELLMCDWSPAPTDDAAADVETSARPANEVDGEEEEEDTTHTMRATLASIEALLSKAAR